MLKLVEEHLKEVESLEKKRHDVRAITGISAPVKRQAYDTSLQDIDVRCCAPRHASTTLYSDFFRSRLRVGCRTRTCYRRWKA